MQKFAPQIDAEGFPCCIEDNYGHFVRDIDVLLLEKRVKELEAALKDIADVALAENWQAVREKCIYARAALEQK